MCVGHAAASHDSDEVPAIAADFWDDRGARALALTSGTAASHVT
ncbi:MAG: hypothetical protein ACLPUO_05050 [Streptosporangiaceae bacterium]